MEEVMYANQQARSTAPNSESARGHRLPCAPRTGPRLDSCRTPFRIALDSCWFGASRARAYLQKIPAFHARTGLERLVDGCDLAGSPHQGANLHLAAFLAGAGDAAMASPGAAAVRDRAYAEIAGGVAVGRQSVS